MTPDEFFAGNDSSRKLFEVVHRAIEALGGSEMKVTKSQIAFTAKRGFAWVWMPGQYLRNRDLAPLVLSIALPKREGSRRWKQILEPAPGRFMHHLEVYRASDLDEEVKQWLREALDAARLSGRESGRRPRPRK